MSGKTSSTMTMTPHDSAPHVCIFLFPLRVESLVTLSQRCQGSLVVFEICIVATALLPHLFTSTDFKKCL